MYQLVIFDWQGTLTDLRAQFVNQFCHTVDIIGLPKVEPDKVIALMHLDICYLIQKLYPEAAYQTQRAALLNHFNLYRLHHHHDVCLYAGVEELLRKLRNEHIHIGIATAASTATIEAELKHAKLESLIDAYKTPDLALCKPAPDMLIDLMAEFGCDQQETVMIGDSRCDFEAAMNAKIDFIGLHLRSETLVQDILEAKGKVASSIEELHLLLN